MVGLPGTSNISVTVSPSSVTVGTGAQQQFTANVTGKESAMQLHLEIDEINLLANILLERICEMSTQEFTGSGGQLPTQLRHGPGRLDNLLDKVLARDLRLNFDELEQVDQLLSARRRRLTKQIAWTDNYTGRPELQRQLKLMDHIIDRVTQLSHSDAWLAAIPLGLMWCQKSSRIPARFGL